LEFEPDIHLVEDLKPKSKVIPFIGKKGAISGEPDE